MRGTSGLVRRIKAIEKRLKPKAMGMPHPEIVELRGDLAENERLLTEAEERQTRTMFVIFHDSVLSPELNQRLSALKEAARAFWPFCDG